MKEEFNKAYQALVKNNDSEIDRAIEKDCNSKIGSYYGYFDNHMHHMGFSSVNCVPVLGSKSYVPYINFHKENRFEKPLGVFELIEMPNLKKACEVLAKYIHGLMQELTEEDLKEKA